LIQSAPKRQLIGGDKFLPSTISAADRFARLSYNLKASPKYKDPGLAVASAFSQIRAMSVPLGMSDPDQPNISSTLCWDVRFGAETGHHGPAF
jgi:choloylglycine hydrolase